HAGHGAGSGAGGIPLLTGALLVYYAFYVLGSAGRLLPGTVMVPAGGTLHAPRTPGGFGGESDDLSELTTACRLTMGIGMFAMLLTL
ncbi:DUF5134 domain-containing protein, partial [Streptomyces sp. McG3]